MKIINKGAPRFELGIKDLQSSALPLGHAAGKDSIESFYDLNSKVSHSLLFICNGHGAVSYTHLTLPTTPRV